MNGFSIILVIDCGSSSIKLSVLDTTSCKVLMTGITDGINPENASIVISGGESTKLAYHSCEDTLEAIAVELEKHNLVGSVILIGHRIAHGGNILTELATIIDEVINDIRQVSSLAPLHNYADLSGIESAQHPFPGVQQVAVFNTSFYQTVVPETYLYGLPWKHLEELDVCHYGFRDTSHRYISQRAHKPLNLQSGNSGLAVAYLGNGVPICAVRNGQNVDISMGMTPLKGLAMGTRSGGVDFNVMTWVASETNQTLSDPERVMNKESGLLGISGLSFNLCILEKARCEGHEHTQLAARMSVRRISRHIAGHAASLRRLDGIVFTGGIGENSALARRLVIEHLAILGVNIDSKMNNLSDSHGERIVSNKDARVTCAVIPTSKEKMIARDVIALSKINIPVEFA